MKKGDRGSNYLANGVIGNGLGDGGHAKGEAEQGDVA